MCKGAGLGLTLELVAAVFCASSYFYMYRNLGQVSLDFFVFFCYLFQFSCLAPVYSVVGTRSDFSDVLHTNQKWFIIVRSFLGASNYFIFMTAIKYIQLADAVTISQCATVFVFPLAFIILREQLNTFHVICVVFCVSGIMLISRPTILFGGGGVADDLSWEKFIGVMSSILYSISVALCWVIQRKITTPPSTSLFLSSILPVPVLTVVVIVSNSWKNFPCKQSYPLVAAALTSTFTSYLRLASSSLEEAHVLGLVKTIEVPLIFLVQRFITMEGIEWTTYAGALVICACLLVVLIEGVIRRGRRVVRMDLLRIHRLEADRTDMERVISMETTL